MGVPFNDNPMFIVQDMNVPIVEPDVKKDRIKLLVDYFTINRNNHQVHYRNDRKQGAISPAFYEQLLYSCDFLRIIRQKNWG